jgi:hypothetical protein
VVVTVASASFALALGVPVDAAAGLLVIAGADHLRRPARFRETVAAHGWLPASLLGAGTAAIAGAELLIGTARLAASATTGLGSSADRVTSVAVAIAFLGFVAYLAWLRRARPGVPCGCGPYAVAGPVAQVRAGALAAVAVAYAVAASAAAGVGPTAGRAILLGPAVLLAVLLALLPAALSGTGGVAASGWRP